MVFDNFRSRNIRIKQIFSFEKINVIEQAIQTIIHFAIFSNEQFQLAVDRLDVIIRIR
jgi:hypothetical protein